MMSERIPVVVVPPGPTPIRAGTAVVVAADAIAPRGNPLVRRLAAAAHGAACLCCRPRAALAEVLNALFVGRGRGTVPWFDRVELRLETDAELLAGLADPLVAARFRLAAEAVGDGPSEDGEAARGGGRAGEGALRGAARSV